MAIICKIEINKQPMYFEWSTVCDDFRTYAMTLEEFKEYYREEYGRSSMNELEHRLKRVELVGTSSRLHDSMESVIKGHYSKRKLIKKLLERESNEPE